MTKIAVLAGGNSDERAVSLRSGTAVTDALTTAGYEVATIDRVGLNVDSLTEFNVVFPVLHGAGGEDGSLQAELEQRNITFVGTGSEASRLCFDKWQYRESLGGDLPLPDGAIVGADDYESNALASGPFVLKPLDGGSSIDTYIVRDPGQTPHDAIIDSFTRHPTMLMEKLIEGVELTVGVLGDEAIGIIEIIPPADGEFDYENKYNGATQELCPPEHVDANVLSHVYELGLRAHELADCRDFSRTDIMYETASGKLYVLETNTIPGMTDQSLFPKIAAYAGLDMPALCDKLVQMALARK
jgi:D-alanine-D-alanine ligase